MLERPTSIPDAPGSYQFKDADGRIIYVGKARSLRSRVGSYFQDRSQLHPRTVQMLERAASVEWIQVGTDVEALMLECDLIKTHRPRFNIRLVDDKSYPYLAITVDQTWPRATVMRGAKRKGTRYFGPYAHAYAIRSTLDLLLRSFPVRTCSDVKFGRHQRIGRPCLLYDIERCSGPCVGAVDRETYDRAVEELMAFLDGDNRPVLRRLERAMHEASEALEYERAAARLRDQLAAVRLAVERQQVVTDKPEDLDAIGIAEDDLGAAVQVLHVRRGRVVGRHGFFLEKVEPLDAAGLVGRVLEQHYADTPLGVPYQVLVPNLPEDPETHRAWLERQRGGRVDLRAPERGRKRELVATAARNAAEELTRHRLRRANDLTSRARALDELSSALGLTQAPLRIECYDMSHLQGSDYVGSMVVFEDGLPRRSEYRRFRIRSVAGNDDYAAMEEVLTRRLRHLVDTPDPVDALPASEPPASQPPDSELPDSELPDSESADAEVADSVLVDGGPEEAEEIGRRRRPSRFTYPPQLLLLDGGKGQLHVGERVLANLGLSDRIDVVALAKQLEEVFVPGKPEPVRLPRDFDAIYLLQQLRDEAHRFAIGFHRQLRDKRMTRSVLEGVPGLGPTRRQRLATELGGVRAVRAASLETLLALPWLPDNVGRALYEHLHPPAGRAAREAV